MSNKYNIALLALAVTLAGCSKKEDVSTANAPAAEAQSVPGLQSIAKDAHGNDIYKEQNGAIRVSRAPLLPLDRYILINTDTAFRANGDAEIAKVASLYRTAFWAGAKRNDDMLAQDFVPAAWGEKDAFKLSDLAKQNKDMLDAAYAQARKQRHYAIYAGSSDGITIGRYDSERKGFEVNFTIGEKSPATWEEPRKGAGSKYWSLTQLGTTSELGQMYVPASEEEARRVEGLLSGQRDSYGSVRVPAYYLTHVVGATDKPNVGDHHSALLVTDGVIAVDPKTKAQLFTIDMGAVSPKPVVNDYFLRRYLLGEKASQ